MCSWCQDAAPSSLLPAPLLGSTGCSSALLAAAEPWSCPRVHRQYLLSHLSCRAMPWLSHSKGCSLLEGGGCPGCQAVPQGSRECVLRWASAQEPPTCLCQEWFLFFFFFPLFFRKSLDGFLGPRPIWDSWKLRSNNSKYLNYNYFHLLVFVYLLFQESSSSTQNSFIVIEFSSPLWFEESCADSV